MTKPSTPEPISRPVPQVRRPRAGRDDEAPAPAPAPAQLRVLVVDDHPANARLLARSLEGMGYAVTLAASGGEALRLIPAWGPDVVLLDVLMPDLSGIEVLRRLRREPATADLPVVMVSGLDDTRDIVDGLAQGANDYVTKPINLPVLHARLATQTALKRARDELKRTARRLAAEIDRHERELQVAAHVQRSILPRTPPETAGLATAWCYEPATEVGGDLFDVVPLPGGRTLLFVADAMGHGVQAALVASTVKATLTAHRGDVEDLARLMGRLDEVVGHLFEDRFVTAAACVVDPDPAGPSLRYAIAGHPPILVAGRSGVTQLQTGGLPLGTGPGWPFREGEIALEPGAALLLYSDGVTEAEDPDGRLLGVAGLAALLEEHAAACPIQLTRSLRRAVDDYRGPVPLADDLTLLAAKLI